MRGAVVAGLLVSVRTAAEAATALAGGAAVIDLKEPKRGPLGRAEVSVWSAVRAIVPDGVPVSVALGEMREWTAKAVDARQFAGITYRKLGLAGAGPGWRETWEQLRRDLGVGPSWIAVVYADWENARAPRPDEVLDAAVSAVDCAGILVDTWDKTRPSPIDLSWARWVARARRSGRLVALAGGLDESAIARLAGLKPDLFAVRGAACIGGDRLGPIDPDRVARLARAAARV